MKRLLPLLVALACGAAHAVPLQTCPNVSDFVLRQDVCGDGTEDCCPANLSSPTSGANLTSTSSDGSFVTDKDSGTAYACAKPSGEDAPTAAELIAGTDCDGHETVTVSATGTVTFTGGNTVDGLTASTEHILYYLHDWDHRVSHEIVASAAFTTLAGGGGGGSDLTGTVYVVSTTGDDADDGLDDSTAWATLTKVGTSVNTAGADVCMLPGTYTDQYLSLDWGGSGSDRGTLMSCYVNGGAIYKWDTGPDASNAANRAVIDITGMDCQTPVIGIASSTVDVHHIDITGSGHNCTNWYDIGAFLQVASSAVSDVEFEDVGCDAWGSATEARSQNKEERVRCFNISNGSEITIRDSTLQNAYGALQINWNANRIAFVDNTVTDMVHNCIGIQGDGNAQRDLWVLIKGNNGSECNSMTSDGVQLNASAGGVSGSLRQIAIIGNQFGGDVGENGIDVKGGGQMWIEGNFIEGWPGDNDGPCTPALDPQSTACDMTGGTHDDRNGGSGGTMHGGGGVEVVTQDILFTGNVCYNSKGCLNLVSGTWHDTQNTYVWNKLDYTGAGSTYDPADEPIFYGSGNTNGNCTDCSSTNNVYAYHTHEISWKTGNVVQIDGHVFATDNAHAPEYAFGVDNFTEYTDIASYAAVLAADSGFTGVDGVSANACANCIEGAVNFVTDDTTPEGDYATTGMDLNLDTGSAAIDAAVPVTYTNGSGAASQTVIVDNADRLRGDFGSPSDRFYHPGMYIQIGGGPTVQIESISGDTLTIDTPDTWSDGEAVRRVSSGGTVWDDSGACQVNAAC